MTSYLSCNLLVQVDVTVVSFRLCNEKKNVVSFWMSNEFA